jgi:hypothetical protein
MGAKAKFHARIVSIAPVMAKQTSAYGTGCLIYRDLHSECLALAFRKPHADADAAQILYRTTPRHAGLPPVLPGFSASGDSVVYYSSCKAAK